MSSTNQRYNQAAINQFRRELQALFDDITDIDIRCLNKAVNVGLADVKRNTNVVSGLMRRSWRTTPAVKSASGVEKSIENNVHYANDVNYGHRIVSKNGETVGFVRGQFMLEKAINKVDKQLLKEFQKEVERVGRRHDR